MKISTLAGLSLATLAIITGCNSTAPQTSPIPTPATQPLPPISATERIRIENDATARRYLKICQQNHRTIPLGRFGWSEVHAYWKAVPELQAARDYFEQCNDELVNVLMQDEEYRMAKEACSQATREEKRDALKKLSSMKSSVYRRLNSTSDTYRHAREKRDSSLRESNAKTLEYIIDDYNTRGEIFPVDWIKTNQSALQRTKRVNTTDKD